MVIEINFLPLEVALDQEWIYEGGGQQCLLLISNRVFQANYEASRNKFYVYEGYPIIPLDKRGWPQNVLSADNDPSVNYGLVIDGVAPVEVDNG